MATTLAALSTVVVVGAAVFPTAAPAATAAPPSRPRSSPHRGELGYRGDVNIADINGRRVRTVDTSGTIDNFAGNPAGVHRRR